MNDTIRVLLELERIMQERIDDFDDEPIAAQAAYRWMRNDIAKTINRALGMQMSTMEDFLREHAPPGANPRLVATEHPSTQPAPLRLVKEATDDGDQ